MTDRVLGTPSSIILSARDLPTAPVRLWVVLAALLAGCLAGSVAAQDGSEIRVGVAQYGVGNAARAGDWVGVQVELLDSAPEERNVILRLSVRDADGDLAMYDRVVTANPGVEQSFWLYARLPYQAEQDAPPGITVYEAVETAEGINGPGYRAGRLLGRFDPTMTGPSRVLPPTLGLAAVVGPYAAGIEQYAVSVQGRPWAPFGHELTHVTTGLDTARLPDQWQGLGAFEVLLWSESTTRSTEPTGLTPERAAAIREWVERGGHLVILLPPAGDPWFATQHALSGILPDINRPERRDAVDLERLRPLLSESVDVPLPNNAVLHTFTPRPGADARDARRVLDTPDGSTLVIQRIVGSGAVTVVGLDLTAGPLRRFGLPDADAFWHRVLGRRGNMLRPEEIVGQDAADAAAGRRDMDFDHDISSVITRRGRAVQGVLFGLVVFITYWLVAGPLGFMLLRRRGLQQHAWVGFVVCTAGFTALAWLGATALRPNRVAYTHLTLLESVHGEETARARTWSSLMLPMYGQATVSVEVDGDAPPGRAGSGDLLAPWEPSDSLSGWSTGFPDNSGYRVDARSPDSLTVPARATIKQFRSDFAGPTGWQGITLRGDPASLDDPRVTREGLRLTGVLEHNLPGPLEDVRVFISPGQTRILPPGTALAGGAIAGVTVLAPQFADREWLPGQALDLGVVSAGAAGGADRSSDYFRAAVREGVATGELVPGALGGDAATRLTAVRFLSQFAPPNYRDDRDTVANRLGRRFSTHGWDLGRWLTTPCVIVTGFVTIDARDASPDGAPYPLYVDGRPADASGMTMVTWIYPLPDEPPRWFARPGDGLDTGVPQTAPGSASPISPE